MQQTIRPRRDSWPHNLERRETRYLHLRRLHEQTHGGSAPLSGADRDRDVVSAEPLPPHADYRDMGTGECEGIISEDMRGTGLSTLPRTLISRRFSRSDSAIVDPAAMRILMPDSPVSSLYSEKNWLKGEHLTETPPTSPDTHAFPLPLGSDDRHDGFQRLNSCDSEMAETAMRPLLSLTIDTGSTPLRSHDTGLTLAVGTPETVYCKGFDSPSRPLAPMRRHIPKGSFSSLFGSAAQPALPGGWRRVEHCQGSTYFVNDHLRIATPSRMDDPILRKALEPYLASLLSNFPDGSVPEGHEAVLCLDDDTRRCEYYMCNHEEMIVYWLEDVTAEDSEYRLSIPETVSDRHLYTYMKVFYFAHVQNFPHRPLTNAVETEVHCKILYGLADIATSDTSTCAFTEQELCAFRNVIEGSSKMGPTVQRTEMIARFEYFYLLSKFYNHHGESDARLERTKSILVNDVVPSEPPAWPLRILTFLLLFNAPDRHMREIGNIFVDEVVYGKYFEKLMVDLIAYWKDFALTATVMMTVNVGFLAIPGVDISGFRGQFLHYTSVTSLALSFASMIVSVILVQIHGPYSRCQNSITAQRYFERHLRFGPLLLATMYCLPFVFFVWSAIAFSAAFVLFSTFTSLIGNIAFLAATLFIGFAIASVVAFFWNAADDAAAHAHVFQPGWWRWDEFEPRSWTSWFSTPPSLPLHTTG